MTTISVPINDSLHNFINEMIENHEAETKAEVVRRALYRMQEEEAINAVLKSEREVEEGKIEKWDPGKFKSTK